MVSWILATLCTTWLFVSSPTTQDPPAPPPESQPASSQPGASGTTLRKPPQAAILRGLLRREERPAPIRPQDPGTGATQPEAGKDASGQPLLLEGTLLVERPGRLVIEGDRAKFVLQAGADSQATQSLEILPNQLLEAMEREAQGGMGDFIVTAEVTRYRDRNYLILRKILRRVAHGNLSP